jgi:AcrR family transcriptional regulator
MTRTRPDGKRACWTLRERPAVEEQRPMATTNRDTATRTKLLDAAERILVTEGYPAVTSRRVERAAGLNSKLVHYHFGTMDDLFVAIFTRRGEEGLERFRLAMVERPSVRTIWEFALDPIGYNLEFAVVAKHRPAVRDAIVSIATRFRSMQIEALAAILADRQQVHDDLSADFLVLVMNGLSQILGMEDNLGISDGHEKTVATIERLLARYD